MASVSDDDIIRRRLLIEGDGGGDDRRIGSLLKMFIKWCQATESDEESYATFQKMMMILAQCDTAMEKTLSVYEMNLTEQKTYEQLNNQIEKSIKEAFDKINECKTELQQAKRIRKNRQEYDALAKMIQQHPDRQDTMRQLEELDKEMESFKATKQSLEEKLEMRRKQFHVLIAAIHEMQSILDGDDETSEVKVEMDTT
ncbi:THO complex subunit 7 homolog [Lineus longissimus]|uniref:THO complex subunit 7 homolog n=1 Tax=Lineus longissimus TaxID=88925 RepID=UPI002B4D1C50